PQGRLPPAGHPGAVLPLQRRLRRGDVLRRRRLRGAQGLGHRQGLDLAAPGRARPRSTARRGRGLPGRREVRRAGRHGRHLPPARARGGRSGCRRRHLCGVLVPRLARPRRHLRPATNLGRVTATATPDLDEVVEADADIAPDVPWITLVWNDPVNLMTYVTYVFQTYFGYSREKAEKLMMDVHVEGRAVVSHGSREEM